MIVLSLTIIVLSLYFHFRFTRTHIFCNSTHAKRATRFPKWCGLTWNLNKIQLSLTMIVLSLYFHFRFTRTHIFCTSTRAKRATHFPKWSGLTWNLNKIQNSTEEERDFGCHSVSLTFRIFLVAIVCTSLTCSTSHTCRGASDGRGAWAD